MVWLFVWNFVLMCVACPIWSALVYGGQPFPPSPSPHTPATKWPQLIHFHFLPITFPFFYIFRTTFSSICLPYLVCGGQTFPRVPPLIPTPQNGRAHTLPFKVKQHFHFLPSTFTFFGGPLLAVLACTIWSVLVKLFPWVPPTPLIPTPQNAFALTPYNHTRSYYTFTFHPVLSLSF